MQAIRADAAEAAVTRSYLFVPGDSERKLRKAADSGADALIIDLEDSVETAARPHARQLAAEYLGSRGDAQVWVRINPLDSPESRSDLQAVMPAAPCGIVVPKARGARELVELASVLADHEQRHGRTQGTTMLMPIATERPAALFHLHEYADATPRLAALTWGAEDLSAALGAAAVRDEAGHWLAPYALARSLCLFAAAAAGVPAVDTVFTDFRNEHGLRAAAAAARRDGFSGMLAIHPAQVALINEAFMPSADEIERAQRIVDLFAANPGAGTLGMDGEMLDRPHWLKARKVLENAGRAQPGRSNRDGRT
jgi:citrate lyase subunit beta/citryl-CoA lyase